MNLLPEGEPLRAMTRAVGVARDDILGLIAETGRDLAGGFASLAGAQDKLPLALRADVLAIPTGGAASTHILKPNPRLPGSAGTTRCAWSSPDAAASPPPTSARTRPAQGRTCWSRVTIARRGGRGSPAWIRKTSALGRPPAAEYQHNQSGVPGPSLADMFGLVREHMTARDIDRLLDAVIFNIAVGDVDGHAKNHSILLGADGPVQLAPLYDLMSGLDFLVQHHRE